MRQAHAMPRWVAVPMYSQHNQHQRRRTMGELIDKTKGKVKQAIGDLTGNKELKHEGERDEAKGKVKGAVEDVKNAVKDTGQAIKDAVK